MPDNASYTKYADVGRAFVVWNVFAAPELSLKPRQWCFPIAGCVSYRGYFNEQEARDEAARLKLAGDDVWVSGVPAYSTLGYFDDPVLSTFVRWPEVEVARMVFHELAHQVVYVKDDTQFNESFAAAVEEAGVEALAEGGKATRSSMRSTCAPSACATRSATSYAQTRARLDCAFTRATSAEPTSARKRRRRSPR